jgi:selenocysteine lyase/cysteine desulfurase
MDVGSIEADFVVAGSHKWLLAPEGIGLFWSRPEARALLTVASPGWRMYPDPFNFERSDWSPPDSARRFEPGTLNNAAIHGLNAALGLLDERGAAAIGQSLRQRSDCLTEGLQRLPGVQVTSPLDQRRRSGIVTFRAAATTSESLVKHLSEHGIHTARRGRQVRLSPHFYTPFEQLEGALAAITRLV